MSNRLHQSRVHQEDWWCHGKVKKRSNSDTRLRAMTLDRYTQTNNTDIDTDDVSAGLLLGTGTHPNNDRSQAMAELSQRSAENGLSQMQYYTKEELQNLTDDEILIRLPKSKSKDHNAKRILRCADRRSPACTAVATTETQGFCTSHFCDLARTGLLPKGIEKRIPGQRHLNKEKTHNKSAKRRERALNTSARAFDHKYNTTQRIRAEAVFDKTLARSIQRCTTSSDSDPSDQISPRTEQLFRAQDQVRSKHEKPSGLRKNKQKHLSKKDDLIESGEYENEIEHERRRTLSENVCVGPMCYNTVLSGGLCTKCQTFLIEKNARKPQANTSPSKTDRAPRPSRSNHHGEYQEATQVMHHTDVQRPRNGFRECGCHECNEVVPVPRYGRSTDLESTPKRTNHSSQSRRARDDLRHRVQYQLEQRQEPHSSDPAPDHSYDNQFQRRPRNDHANHQNDYAQDITPYHQPPHQGNHMRHLPINDEYRYRHHDDHAGHRRHNESYGQGYNNEREQYSSWELEEPAGPSSMLLGATSISIEDHSATDPSFVESVTPYSRAREACRSHRCANWGNSACNGYCNECYKNRR